MARERRETHSTAVQYFNGRRYHVLTTHLVIPLARRGELMYSNLVFVNETQVFSYRTRFLPL